MSEPSSSPDFDQLLEHRGWVRRLCRQLAAQPADADEVEQETWRRALSAPPRHGANVRGWLSTVVRSVSAQKWRSDARRKAAYDRFDRREIVKSDSSHVGPDPLEQRETFAALNRMLLELESPYGETVFLRYVEDLTPTAIAKRLNIPVTTVKSRLRRGLALLRARSAQQLGRDWRARLLVFTPSMTAASSAAIWTTVMTLTTTRVAAGVAAIILLAVATNSLMSPPELTENLGSGGELELSADSMEVSVTANILEDQAITEPVHRTEEFQDLSARVLQKVQVIDAATLEAVPLAKVFAFSFSDPLVDQAAVKRSVQDSGYWTDREPFLSRHGREYEADEQGVCMVEVFGGRMPEIAASVEGKFGAFSPLDLPVLQHEEEAIQVQIRERFHLSVTVQNELSQPMHGVKTGLSLMQDSGWNGPYARASTRNGRAEYKNIQHIIHDRINQENSMRVIAFIGDSEFPSALLPVGVQSGHEAVITVPETVSLRALLPENLQEPPMVVWNGELERDQSDANTRSDEYDLTTLVQDGELNFPFVRPGFKGQLRLMGSGPIREITSMKINVPLDAIDEHVIHVPEIEAPVGIPIRIVQGADPIELTGGWRFNALPIRDDFERLPEPQLNADSVFVEPEDWVDSEPDTRVYLFSAWKSIKPGVTQVAALNADLARERFDTLELQTDDQIIASGRVVNQYGEPIPNLRLLAHCVGQASPGRSFYISRNIFISTNELGEFEIRGPLGVLTSLETVALGGLGHGEIELIQGKSDQELMVHLRSDLKATVIADPGIPKRLEASLETLNGDPMVGTVEVDERSGEIAPWYLGEGEVSLVLKDQRGLEVFRSQEFELIGGRLADPEFLDPIDLRSALTLHSLQVVDQLGNRIEDYGIWDRAKQVWLSERAPTELVTGAQSFAVDIDAPGFRVAQNQLIAGETTIQMEAAIQCKVEIQSADQLPVSFQLVAECIEGEGLTLSRSEQAEAGETVSFELPQQGEWRFALYPHDAEINSESNPLVELRAEIPAEGLESPLELRLD